jgi:predicted O-methyltransferase YrrM
MGTYGLKVFKDVDSLAASATEFSRIASYIPDGRRLYREIASQQSGKISPIKFDSAEELGSFLYAFVMETKPKCVVETGVANGLTTNLIMAALDTYGGELHSFDINPECQSVYNGRGKWNFHLLSRNYKKQVKEVVSSISNIDLWIHDSDHSHSWQSFEYSIAASKLKASQGILVSDDIDCSTAFGKLIKSLGTKGWAVFDERKFFGIVKINT